MVIRLNIHTGVDKGYDLIHAVVVTAANVPELIPAAGLLHGDEQFICGDAGY